MKDFEKLSERQRNILRFMERYISDNGFPPTIRDIGAATGIDSTSVVNYNLNKLVNAGFLERVAAKSRGMRLVRPLPGSQQAPVRPAAEIIQIPLVGRIAAGEPVNVPDDLYADMENPVELPASMLTGVNLGEVYALTVKGDSMIDAMIRDGDIIIMRHTATAHNGDMVAVWLDEREETTLKYFYDEGERIRLQPAHPTMDPIYVDARQCHVQGKVLSVIRQMR
jgi:repressor LexA